MDVNKQQFNDDCLAKPSIAQAIDFTIQVVVAASTLAKDTGDDGHHLL